MSSPAGLQYSQENLLARWMPSSSRAGVILNPSPELSESFRHRSNRESEPPDPDDSFTSHFAPLPASANSSCLNSLDAGLVPSECVAGLDGLNRQFEAETTMAERPRNCRQSASLQNSVLELDTLEQLASKSQDLSLVMKLEQLRQWQQHMQEQLKAHQLEELLRLQEEQQRLLGLMNGSQRCGADPTQTSASSGTHWGEGTLQGPPPHTESLFRPPIKSHGAPPATHGGPGQDPECLQAGKQRLLQRGEDKEVEIQAEQKTGRNNHEQSFGSHSQESDTASVVCNEDTFADDANRREERGLQDRPIKPGVRGQKQTFEDLLEEQLRLEEERLKNSRQQSQDTADAVKAPPKRSFLKRGEGLNRFTNNRKGSLPNGDLKKEPQAQAQAMVISRSISEPTSILRSTLNQVQRPAIQRKTAVLNKENHPRGSCSSSQDVRGESRTTRTKVLGSHQNQNTEGSERPQTVFKGRRNQLQQRLSHPPGKEKEQQDRKAGLSAQEDKRPMTRGAQANSKAVSKVVGVAGGTGMAKGRTASTVFRKDPEGGRARSEEEEEGDAGAAVQDYSFDSLFQEKLRRWECNRQQESMELGEFELLEQAAEELSFSSNSSFVMKVLQMDQQHQKLLAARGLHQRRLSSTPIKSPRPSPPKALQSCTSAGTTERGSSSIPSCDSKAAPPVVMDNKVENTAGDVNMAEEDKDSDSHREASEVSFCCVSEFGDREVTTFPSSQCFAAPTNPPYDKRSYQDDGQDESVLMNPDESTLLEDKDGWPGGLEFDDNDTWNDPDEAVGSANDGRRASLLSKTTANELSPPEKALTRKVAVSKDKGVVGCSANQEPAPPLPTSQLMARLFPSLKPKTQTVPPLAPEPRKAEENTGQQAQSRQLRERLVELEIEIERFKKENAALAKLRQENERNQESLRKERSEFERERVQEQARFEECRKEENRKLQKARKLFERHAAAARALPDKTEREDLQNLRQQMNTLQEELKRRETRWSTTHGRLRQQIDSLSAENSSLREEVNTLEKLRLNAWRKGPPEGDKERRMFESSGPSSTKGVKFAVGSPLDTSVISPPQSSSAMATRGSPSRNSVGTTGIRSSLRKTSGPASSSSTGPVKSPQETSMSLTSDKPLTQDQSHSRSPLQNSPEPEASETQEPAAHQEVTTHPDGKVEQVLPCGGRVIVFPNGTRKEVSADGLAAKVTFFNGDTKQVLADQRVIYYYSDAQTTHTTYPDGMEVLHFPNNQTEKHFPDGRKEITFPDQTVKNLYPDGREESVLVDGTIIQVNPDGSKEIRFNTGQKEIHTADYKQREYPDGTVKTVYTDGRQETRYPNGRLRIKDKDGTVVTDSRV